MKKIMLILLYMTYELICFFIEILNQLLKNLIFISNGINMVNDNDNDFDIFIKEKNQIEKGFNEDDLKYMILFCEDFLKDIN